MGKGSIAPSCGIFEVRAVPPQSHQMAPKLHRRRAGEPAFADGAVRTRAFRVETAVAMAVCRVNIK